MTALAERPTIRPIRAGDHADLRAITDARDLLCPRPLCFGEPRLAMTPATCAAYATFGCSYIAELKGEPVGYLLAQPISFVDSAPLTVWVEEIDVWPTSQRDPIGLLLYRALGFWARAEGVRAILTRVDDAAALALHRRIGFETHATGTIVWRLGSR